MTQAIPGPEVALHPPNWIQRLGDLPGALAQACTRKPGPESAPTLTLSSLAGIARRSPRANGYLSLEPGLHCFEGPEGGVLTWASQGRTAFAVGGVHHQVGAGFERNGVLLRAFQAHLTSAGYRRALLFPVAVAERHSAAAAGFHPLVVGSEALISLPDFSLAGKVKADLRQMLNRASGRYELRAFEVDAATANSRARDVYLSWLNQRPAGHRMTLLVGTPSFERGLGRRFWVVEGPDGQVRALATATPGWADPNTGTAQGWGVDVMARCPNAPAGAMELLIHRIIDQLHDEGADVLSLGACPMDERGGIPGRDSPILRWAFRFLRDSRIGDQLFHFRSLAFFKNKFAPNWVPVSFAAWPRINPWALYLGCRMWGLFGPPKLLPERSQPLELPATVPPRIEG